MEFFFVVLVSKIAQNVILMWDEMQPDTQNIWGLNLAAVEPTIFQVIKQPL
jgi:hypothetical protein